MRLEVGRKRDRHGRALAVFTGQSDLALVLLNDLLGDRQTQSGITVLDDLDEDALVRVLKEPRNSLVKQYKELLGMDNVELTFTDEALHAIARKTIERKTGARGLRSVMESILLPIMYEVPSDATIIRVTVDEDTVEGGEAHLEYGAVRKRYKNQAALS